MDQTPSSIVTTPYIAAENLTGTGSISRLGPAATGHNFSSNLIVLSTDPNELNQGRQASRSNNVSIADSDLGPLKWVCFMVL
ncbi:hypothetical protein RTP6_001365 [Batrachochytrium dendrobatidis]